eukprot:s2507_g6.t1
MKSGSAHCDLELADESGSSYCDLELATRKHEEHEEEEKEEEKEKEKKEKDVHPRSAVIKSSNPHLAGVTPSFFVFLFLFFVFFFFFFLLFFFFFFLPPPSANSSSLWAQCRLKWTWNNFAPEAHGELQLSLGTRTRTLLPAPDQTGHARTRTVSQAPDQAGHTVNRTHTRQNVRIPARKNVR